MWKKKLFWHFISELLNVAIFGGTFATGLFKPKTHVTLLLDTYCERICTRPVNGYVCWFCAHLDFKTYTSETWSACALDDSKKESTQNKQTINSDRKKSTKHFKQKTKAEQKNRYRKKWSHWNLKPNCESVMKRAMFDYLTLTWHNMTIHLNNLISSSRSVFRWMFIVLYVSFVWVFCFFLNWILIQCDQRQR